MGKSANVNANTPKGKGAAAPASKTAAAKPQPQKAPQPQGKGASKKHAPPPPQEEEEESDEPGEGEEEDDDDDDEHAGNESESDAEEEEDSMDDAESYDDAEEGETLEDLGEFLGFWARKVSEDNPLDVCAGDMRVLKISTAALGLNAPAGARASLVVCVPRSDDGMADDEDEEEEGADSDGEGEPVFDEYVITTLSEARPDTKLDLFFTATEYVQFKVVGNAEIHLTGVVTYMEQPLQDDGEDYPQDEDEEEEDLYGDDGGVLMGAHADEDDEEDSEAEADAHGAVAVHRRDAAKRMASRNALPSIMSELLNPASDEDDEDAEESFRPDGDDEDDDDEDEDDDLSDMSSEERELTDMLTAEGAEKQRQKLKGKIEVVSSPQLAPKKSPQQKATPAPKSSPQQKPQAAPTPKRKEPAAAAAASETPAGKKAKTDAATPAAPKTPAGQFKCAHCDRSFAQEAALKQHTNSKHGEAAGAAPATGGKKQKA